MTSNRLRNTLLVGALTCLLSVSAAALETVPERMLRAWDPITFVFSADVNTDAKPSVLDVGQVFERWFEQPGEYVWIDRRTLQFRPSEPWPAFVSPTYVRGQERVELNTLLEPPAQTSPVIGADNLRQLRTISLFLPTPVDVVTLREQIRLEVAPLDPLLAGSTRELPSSAYVVKLADDPQRRFGVRVTVTLFEPVPRAHELAVHLRLGRNAEAPVWTGRYRTAGALRLTALGCPKTRVPVAGAGSDYTPEQAVQCAGDRRSLVAEFSNALGQRDAPALRAAIHLLPDPGPLTLHVDKKLLHVSAEFVPGQTYRLQVNPSSLVDADAADVHQQSVSTVYVRFPKASPALRWQTRHGVVERYGVQHVPVLAHGVSHADLRVHRVASLDRRYWPFPRDAVLTNDVGQPAGPGEQPVAAWDSPAGLSHNRLREHLRLLDAPVFSDLVPLGVNPQNDRTGGAAPKGFDLRHVLTRANGSVQPGTYLVGLRDAANSSQRDWMRIQVTDLALSTVTDGESVRFVVTSLRSATPIVGAQVTVEGLRNDGVWTTFIEGETNVLGAYEWRFSDVTDESGGAVRRIVVRHGEDALVLDPNVDKDSYQDNHWSNTGDAWLQWTRHSPPSRRTQQQLHCHLFTERPVYKPAHPVHIKGWARLRERGAYSSATGKAVLAIVGPGDRRWRIPVEFNASGGVYHRFEEPDLPTGNYWVGLEYDGWDTCGGFEFAKRDYVLPELEVSLHGADKVPLDAPFELTATGRFYSGGRVRGQPVRWRVTQFPHTFTANTWGGFKFTSTSAFSASRRLESEAVVDHAAALDENGSSQLQIDPSAEPSARPRRYVVEATVTGTDGRTVTATRQVLGLPALLPGIKMPQVVRDSGQLAPQLVVLGTDGKPQAGVALEVRLLRRDWHAQLRAGDHTGGVARYLTEPVDTVIAKRTVHSTGAPQEVPFTVSDPGVYLLEVAARDRLGRLISVTADVFVAPDAVMATASQTWAKAPGRLFKVAVDKSQYGPRDTAQLVLQSPFSSARALMVIEDPRGNEYRWIDVANGQALVDVPLHQRFAPRLAVHFLLLRGRISQSLAGAGLDLGKPSTAAATVKLNVAPTGQMLNVSLTHPATARPGQTIPVTVTLRDAANQPVAGEVSLWLVDQAVLALGRERRLNPLPDFVRARAVRSRVHDTRGDLFGLLPLVVYPGGGAGDTEALDLLDNVTPRKNFVAVPYYEPSLRVPETGEITVQVSLPDNLTVFKLRAKGVTQSHRFGSTAGSLGVRIPVVVQPALPPFVRPGDRFTAGAVIRAVDGKIGSGRIQVATKGLTLLDPDEQVMTIGPSANRAEFGFSVPPPRPGSHANGDLSPSTGAHVEVSVAAERSAEASVEPERDAFTMTLPLVHAPQVETRRQLSALEPGAAARFEPVEMPVGLDSGSVHISRRLLASHDVNVLNMMSASSFLAAYPYGCTEQRIAKATGGLALKKFADVFGWQGLGFERLLDGVDETLAWIAKHRDANGLVGYWPGSEGVVSVTAWSLQFVVTAREAGHEIPEALELDLVRTLRRAVRSDFPLFVDSSQFSERVWALTALADAGLADAGYAAELARRAQFLSAESLAQVLRVLVQSGSAAEAELARLRTRLWSLMRTRLQGGEPVYMGLDQSNATSRLILPGETRSVAQLLRTAVALNEDEARQLMLVNALAGLAGEDGWGSTNANAAVMNALSEQWHKGPTRVSVLLSGGTGAGRVDGEGALLEQTVSAHEAFEVRAPRDGDLVHLAVETRIENHGSPALSARVAQGFVVRRSWHLVSNDDAPMAALSATNDNGVRTLALKAGDVIEEHVEVVNFADRYHVAVTAPKAGGVEALDPSLSTAPPEAQPSAPDSISATYVDRRLTQ